MATRVIVTQIEIEAPAEKVWEVLTSFSQMSEWNPFITHVSGDLRPGARLSVCIVPHGARPMWFKPLIFDVKPYRELRWRGIFIFPGLFDGEHFFILEPIDRGRTRLTHGEKFDGALVGFGKRLLDATERGFVTMNVALKQRVEQGNGGGEEGGGIGSPTPGLHASNDHDNTTASLTLPPLAGHQRAGHS